MPPNPDYPHRKPKSIPRRSQNSRLRTHATADGWATVTRASGPSARTLASIQAAHVRAPQGDRWLSKDVSVEALHKDFREMKEGKTWRESGVVRGLRGSLGRFVEGERRVQSAVCLATGSFSAERVGWGVQGRKRAMWQVLLFVEVVEMLRVQGMGVTELYAQDPDFTSVDLGFLREVGITGYQDNEAFGKATKESFVYAPFMEANVLFREVLAPADPILTIHVDFFDDFTRQCDVASKAEDDAQDWEQLKTKIERYGKEREKERLVDFEADGLGGLYVYWKRNEGCKNSVTEQREVS